MESSGIKVSIIKAALFGMITYFFTYVFVSAALFWFDFFSIKKAALISLGILLVSVIFFFLGLKKSRIQIIKPELKEIVFSLGIILAVFILSGEKFGFYGMGQDQGVYQTKTIELIYGNNSNEYDFDYALSTLDNPEDYEFFRDRVKGLQGYYLLGQEDPFFADDNAGGESGLRGVYHGLPTWPAIMALFGKILGLSHMQDCQTLFLIGLLMLTFYTLENFRIKTVCEIAALAVIGTSPQMIWVSKSALTEMFLALIFATFIYLACHKNKDVRMFMWIPVAVFSFVHVSAYTFMPVFVVFSWINYLADKRKRTAIVPLLMLAAYFAGFAFSIKLSTLYTSYNYIVPLIDLLKIPEKITFGNRELMMLVLCAVTVCALLSVLIRLLLNTGKIQKTKDILIEKQGIIIKVFSILVSVFVILIFIKKNHGFNYSVNTNLTAISLACGIITVLLAFAGIILVKAEKMKGITYAAITVSFLYILFYAVLLRPYISYFYYYGRYNVPYLIVPVIFLCVIYRDLSKADWIPAICIGSIFVYLDYDVIMCKTPDDTKVEWNVVEKELEQHRLSNSAVTIDKNHWTQLEWMLILKASGMEVYPAADDLDAQTDKLFEKYDNIYFIAEGAETPLMEAYSSKPFECVNTYSYRYSEDLVNGTDSWTGYPRSFYSEDRQFCEYLLKKQ